MPTTFVYVISSLQAMKHAHHFYMISLLHAMEYATFMLFHRCMPGIMPTTFNIGFYCCYETRPIAHHLGYPIAHHLGSPIAHHLGYITQKLVSS